MAKKKQNEADLFTSISEETGGGILRDVGYCRYFIDTGNLALNYIISGKFYGGGYPGGKITEVFGPPASSKSLLGWCALAGAQRMDGIPVYLDCECSANADFAAKAAHIDTSKVLVYEPRHIKQVESKITNVTRAIRARYPDKPILFVWDSIGVSPTEREYKETGLPENCSKAEFKRLVGANEQPGERAKASGALLRKIQPFIDENNVSLFIVNQIRYKIGVMFGSPETVAGGGAALEFYASCRLRTSSQKAIIDSKRKIPLGVNLKFKNRKNRSFTPFLETEGVQLYFQSGINPVGGLLTVLIGAGRVEKTGKGRYKVMEPWAGGKEIAFGASEVSNAIPVELLLECPAVVDCPGVDEMRDYLSVYEGAIALTANDDVKEVASHDDEAADLAEFFDKEEEAD